ncbi:MAG: hypothetical protein IJ770_02520 [Alphaproteobacteria bacterium]|nr:hypothetical protein [Alphaproteobacteria bacterium]
MSQQNIMNVLLYDISQSRTTDKIYLDTHIISALVDGWNQQKYVFPHDKIKFKRDVNTKYRLM